MLFRSLCPGADEGEEALAGRGLRSWGRGGRDEAGADEAEEVPSGKVAGHGAGIVRERRRPRQARAPGHASAAASRADCYGICDDVYAVMAIMSSSVSLATTSFMSGDQSPARVPDLKS